MPKVEKVLYKKRSLPQDPTWQHRRSSFEETHFHKNTHRAWWRGSSKPIPSCRRGYVASQRPSAQVLSTAAHTYDIGRSMSRHNMCYARSTLTIGDDVSSVIWNGSSGPDQFNCWLRVFFLVLYRLSRFYTIETIASIDGVLCAPVYRKWHSLTFCYQFSWREWLRFSIAL